MESACICMMENFIELASTPNLRHEQEKQCIDSKWL